MSDVCGPPATLADEMGAAPALAAPGLLSNPARSDPKDRS
jgi:hypothetical protein